MTARTPPTPAVHGPRGAQTPDAGRAQARVAPKQRPLAIMFPVVGALPPENPGVEERMWSQTLA